jgi:hypothetical protein
VIYLGHRWTQVNTDKKEQVLAEAPWYFVGLDLGQSRDFSERTGGTLAELS